VTDWTTPSPVRSVLKRDGRQVPFDRARIESAVARAQEAALDGDEHFAREVADVVALTLAARCANPDGVGTPHVPGVEEIQDLVEQALVEMGRAPVAKAYILYRDRRSRAREALTITERPDRRGRMPLVRAGGGTSPWDLGRIVAALMEEAQLPREIAEEVAERVEGRVHDAGLRRLSTSLIRELVGGELMAMGLENALQKHEPVGIPRHDLRQLLMRPRRTTPGGESRPFAVAPLGLGGDVGGEVLSRYALEDVIDERTADLHRSGALWIEDLTCPHLALTRAIPAELLLRGEPHPHSGFELLGELAPLVASTGRGLVLEGLHAVAAPMTRAARSTAGLRDLLTALAALAAGAGRQLDLAAPGGRAGSFVARLVRELATLVAAGLPAPRLWLAWEELEPALDGDSGLADAAEALLARGQLLALWHAKGERWVAPGCRRRARERGALACGGAVSLNLPRLARQAGPWREDLFLEALAARVQSGLDAIQALDQFQRRHPAARAEDLRERTTWALTPVGLVEALRILADGEVRPDQGARVLGVLSDATRRLSQERGLTAVVSPLFGERAAVRLARLDASGPRRSQARLFADLPAPEAELDAPYSTGFALPALAGVPGQAHAALLATVRSGALVPLGVGEPSAHEPRPHLAAWRAFDEHRFADRSVGVPAHQVDLRVKPRPTETGPLFQS
jgi:ATP cone domain